MRTRLARIPLLVVLFSCATALGVIAYRAAPAPAEERVPGAVALVDGVRVTQAELVSFWFERYPEEYARTLGALLDERLAIGAAHRDGVRVPRKALEAAVTKEVAARRKQLSSLYGEGLDLEAEVRRAYSMDVAQWQRDVLGPRLHAQLLLERVIRWDTRRRERIEARVIVLDSPERAAAIRGKLAAGADFSLTAVETSLDPSGARGGVLPAIGRGDLAYPGVEERLFAAEAGQVVGPLEVQVEGTPQWHLYKVIRSVAPWAGAFDAHWERLESDLTALPVDAGEYQRWQARMRRASGLRLLRPDGSTWLPPDPR